MSGFYALSAGAEAVWQHLDLTKFSPNSLFLKEKKLVCNGMGLVGLGIFAALALHAIVHTVWGIRRQNPLALIVCVSIAAVIFIGGVVSLFEIPRVSIMLWLLLAVSPLCNEKHKFTPVKL